jgi:hypothetical protein
MRKWPKHLKLQTWAKRIYAADPAKDGYEIRFRVCERLHLSSGSGLVPLFEGESLLVAKTLDEARFISRLTRQYAKVHGSLPNFSVHWTLWGKRTVPMKALRMAA